MLKSDLSEDGNTLKRELAEQMKKVKIRPLGGWKTNLT